MMPSGVFGEIVYFDRKKRFGFVRLDDRSKTGGRDVFISMDNGNVAVASIGVPTLYPSSNMLDPNPLRGRSRVYINRVVWYHKGPRAEAWCYEDSWKQAMKRILEDPRLRIPENHEQAMEWGWSFVGIYGSHRAGDHGLFLNPTRKVDLGFDDQGKSVPMGQYALWVLEFWTIPFGTDTQEDAGYLAQVMGFKWAGLYEGKFALVPPFGWTRHQMNSLNPMMDFDENTYFIDYLGLERAYVHDPAFSDPFIMIHQTPRQHVCTGNCKPIPLPHERVEQAGSQK